MFRPHFSSLVLCLLTTPVLASTLEQQPYGETPDHQQITQYILTNKAGIRVRFINYGGILTAIEVRDRKGQRDNVVLGFPDLNTYVQYNNNYHFGALIGRYANRIAKGSFSIDGQNYSLQTNDHGNTLHSGDNNFGIKFWKVEPISNGARLTYTSPDGEAGFPGNLQVTVDYVLGEDNSLSLKYHASTDKPTLVNLTNHSYFNLKGNGKGSIEGHQVEIAAARYTPTDAQQIPTGTLADVAGTPFDLRKPITLGERLRSADPQMRIARGYDHNWVLDKGGQATPQFAARVYEPQSGRVLEVRTTQPGLQLYTANSLDGALLASSGGTYRQSDALALETQHFPDSPHHPEFPTTLLKPGETYSQETVFTFSTR